VISKNGKLSPQSNSYPTSPWTEAYQNMPAEQARAAQNSSRMPERMFDRDDQRPTHDALFLIYNAGY
jgi:hypothetical protein